MQSVEGRIRLMYVTSRLRIAVRPKAKARGSEQCRWPRRGSSFAHDVCAAQEPDLSFDLDCHAGFKSWLGDADCRHQLADGDDLDLRSDGGAGASVIVPARVHLLSVVAG